MGGGEKGDAPKLSKPRLTPAADAILHSNIPIIAAVNGAAVGWGMELALMADIRIASEKAKFGELFVLRGLCTRIFSLRLWGWRQKLPSDHHWQSRRLKQACGILWIQIGPNLGNGCLSLLENCSKPKITEKA
jgi:hypothetical protein